MKNILLVFGGKSYEHEISVVTASQIYNRTNIKDVNLVPFYVSREGDYFIYNSKKFDLNDFSKTGFSSKNKKFKPVCFVSGERGIIFAKTFFGLKEILKVKHAIIACHGGNGENGKLVSELENAGIASSSGNFDALAVSMNKFLFKQVMRGLKIPVVSGFKCTKNEYLTCPKNILKMVKKIKFPVIIKPNNGGSSIGLFIAKNEVEFCEKISSAFEFDDEVVIEKQIENTREFNVAVVGTRDSYKVSEVDEPQKLHEVLHFVDKYFSSGKDNNLMGTKILKNSISSKEKKSKNSALGGSKLVGEKVNSMFGQNRNFPAKIDDKLKDTLQKYAAKVFCGLGLSGVVRIDFLYCTDTSKIYVCEVNAVPGSLAFYFFSQNSFCIDSFVKTLILIAEENGLTNKNFNPDYIARVLDNSL